jgi:integral membrane protein (TIGR00529 family)
VTEIIKLLAIIAAIILLIKKKWNLEYVILLASLLVGVFFNLNPIQIGNNFVLALIDLTTLKLIGIIVLVYILSGVLRKVESLRDLVDSLQGLVKDYRLILAFIPALLGLIPMPAGAMFSAPMVKEVGGRVGLTPEEETFVNYWFRHIWEFIWPLFPAIILFAGLLKVEIHEVIMVQFPLTIITVIVGFVWEYKNLRKDTTLINKKDILFNLKKLFFGVWPILLIIILVLGTKTDLLLSLVIVILSLIFLNIKKLSPKMLKEIIKNDIDLSVVILIASIMIFKRILQVSGGIEIIPETFAKLGVHPFIVLFSIPFFIAMLTGLGTAALGIGLPVLLPIIIQGEVNLYYAMLVFTGSFVGVMISPMHLCLVVTKNYFKADMGKIYKMLILPLTIITLSALVLVMVRI